MIHRHKENVPASLGWVACSRKEKCRWEIGDKMPRLGDGLPGHTLPIRQPNLLPSRLSLGRRRHWLLRALLAFPGNL